MQLRSKIGGCLPAGEPLRYFDRRVRWLLVSGGHGFHGGDNLRRMSVHQFCEERMVIGEELSDPEYVTSRQIDAYARTVGLEDVGGRAMRGRINTTALKS